MFDAKLLPLQRRLIRPLAGRLHARSVGADSITLAGFALGLLGILAAAYGLYWLALAGLVANRLADGLDGEVARLAGPTDRGAFLDIALDFLFYALFPLGFAIADPGKQGQAFLGERHVHAFSAFIILLLLFQFRTCFQT